MQKILLKFGGLKESLILVVILGLALIVEVLKRRGKVYGGFTKDIDRRRQDEYTQAILKKLEEVLNSAHITQYFKQFLIDFSKDSLAFGNPIERRLPMRLLGVEIQAGRYGIFDPSEDLALQCLFSQPYL